MAAPAPPVIRCLGFTYLRGRKVSRLHVLLLALTDWFLLLLLGRDHPATAPPLAGKRIVVAKIDHLGDVLMITPLLRELRAQAPSCRVDLLLGSWSRELGELLRAAGMCDDIFFYDAPSLNRGGKHKWARGVTTFGEAVRRLRGADIFIDLRPFSPNAILAARLAGVPHRIGFGLRGRAFFLSQELAYSPDRPLGELFLAALEKLGLTGARYEGPALPRSETALSDPAGLRLPPRFVAVHPFSREAKKMAGQELWVKVIGRVASALPVVLLGSREESVSALAARLAAIGNVTSLAGRTRLGEAFEVVAQAAGFVGIDSVFAHAATGLGRPTFILLDPVAGLKAAYPENHAGLVFVDPGQAGKDPEGLAAAVLARVGIAPAK